MDVVSFRNNTEILLFCFYGIFVHFCCFSVVRIAWSYCTVHCVAETSRATIQNPKKYLSFFLRMTPTIIFSSFSSHKKLVGTVCRFVESLRALSLPVLLLLSEGGFEFQTVESVSSCCQQPQHSGCRNITGKKNHYRIKKPQCHHEWRRDNAVMDFQRI